MPGELDWTSFPDRRKSKAAVAFLRSSLAKVTAERRGSSLERDLVIMRLSAANPETERTMNDDEILTNLMTVMTAGNETTALGRGWTFTFWQPIP